MQERNLLQINAYFAQHLARFAAVRAKFDPNGMFKSIVGEIIGVM
jgi:hypothetical protein